MPWDEGRARIEDLLANAHLQSVTADLDIARQMIETARRHLESARSIQEDDPEAAYSTAYDGARKACAALLQAQGLRPTTRGGHLAVRDAVDAQFGSLSGGQVLKAFDRLRRRRHETEYPTGGSPLDREEVEEAIARAREIVIFAESLVPHLPVF